MSLFGKTNGVPSPTAATELQLEADNGVTLPMVEWSNMYSKALDMAKQTFVGGKEFPVAQQACCVKSTTGEYFVGMSYGDEISAEQDAIRAALNKGCCSFERIIVVTHDGALVHPNAACIKWLGSLGTNPVTLCDGPCIPDDLG